MYIIRCTICIVMILAIPARAIENLTTHLCPETVTRLLDDGYMYQEEVLVCCPGYTIDTTGKCMPFCQRPCIYGFCKAPDVCDCNEGYEMEKNICVPICKNKCYNGYCSKPDVCSCPNGFELDDKNLSICIPICNPKCVNFSKCTKSISTNLNRCQCISGYLENGETKICQPNCKFACINGFCSAPDTCECFNGYELDKVNKTNCIPKCEPKCQLHSSCVDPNVCDCIDGYKLNEIGKICEPVCEDNMKYSRCIKPPNTWTCIENYQHDRRIDKCVLESCLCSRNGYCPEYTYICECYEGFTKNATSGLCEPNCEPFCENAVCVANNVCQCVYGYHKTNVNNICEHNDFCNGLPCKNGECLITGVCKCKAGYFNSFSYSGESQCDNIQTFIGKIMLAILGVPLLLAVCALIVVYIIANKKPYNIEEQGIPNYFFEVKKNCQSTAVGYYCDKTSATVDTNYFRKVITKFKDEFAERFRHFKTNNTTPAFIVNPLNTNSNIEPFAFNSLF